MGSTMKLKPKTCIMEHRNSHRCKSKILEVEFRKRKEENGTVKWTHGFHGPKKKQCRRQEVHDQGLWVSSTMELDLLNML